MKSKIMKLGDILLRSKIPIYIEDNQQYKRVTIRTKHQGVSIRDTEIGSKIGTKNQFVLKAGQFVLSKIDAMYGAFGIAPSEVDQAIITGNFWAYNYDENKVNIEWLNHFTNSPDFYEICRRASTGNTHRKYLDEDFFLSYEVSLPSLEEQKNVVEKVDSIRKKIELLSSELDLQLNQIENLNQVILQEAVQGKLVLQNKEDEPASELLKRIKAEKTKSGKKEKPLPLIKPEEIPFGIPENWVWCRLGEICDFITKGTTPETSTITNKGAVPYLKVYNIVNQKIDFEYKSQFIDYKTHNSLLRSKVYPGDVLMNIVGPPLGKVAIVPETFTEWNINQALAIFRPVIKEINHFLYYYLCEGSEVFKLRTLGVVGQDNISLEQCRNLLLPLPPILHQKKIIKEIEKQLAITKLLKEHIIANQHATEQLLKALLHQAFEVKDEKTDFALQIAYVILSLEETLKPRGEVVQHKTFWFLINYQQQQLPLTFQNSNFGTFSPSLRESLSINPYLLKQDPDNRGFPVYTLKPDAKEQVLHAFQSKSSPFTKAVQELMQLYCHPIINKRTEQIELLNTVSKIIQDQQTLDLDELRQYMSEWKTPKTEYASKAAKFSEQNTKEILEFILDQRLHNSLLHN